MRLPFKKIFYLLLTLLAVGFVVFHVQRIYRSVQTSLAAERARLSVKDRVPFEKKALTPHLSTDVRILQNTNAVRDFVKFRDSFFAATGGGLVRFSAEGAITKRFTVLDGLPESDLTALAVFNDRLYIGTATKSLVAFDGERFENYVFTDRQTNAVAAFFETDGKLLIGTFGGGLLEFDGANFTEIKTNEKRIAAVSVLREDDDKLYVGTFDNGLWIRENDGWTHFTTAEGLPSNRVVGIALKNENLCIAADFGLAIRQEKTFRTLAVLPALAGLAAHNDRLYLTKDNGEIFTFDNALEKLAASENSQNARLVETDGKLWLASNRGVSQIGEGKTKTFGEAKDQSLTDNFVSAMTFDRNENLWIGSFRGGVDVFSRAGKKIKHIESDAVREINFLQAVGDEMRAATSGGIVRFDANFAPASSAKNDGLPNAAATHFSGDFVATAKGLAFPGENGKFRVLTTVQNLPNNSTYATLQVGKKLYVGTLGGLAEIENNRVVRAYRDSDSNLQTNWVTALIQTNERIFIGTYGGGVYELLPSGEIRAFETETGKFVVNPNALFSDGERLYAGTLAGVKILDLRTQEWKTVRKILPAETVMSIAGDDKDIYFGTTNGIARVEKNHFSSEEMK